MRVGLSGKIEVNSCVNGCEPNLLSLMELDGDACIGKVEEYRINCGGCGQAVRAPSIEALSTEWDAANPEIPS